MRTFRLPAIALLTGITACFQNVQVPHYAPKAARYGKALPVRVAVLYPEEALSAPKRDQDVEPTNRAKCVGMPTFSAGAKPAAGGTARHKFTRLVDSRDAGRLRPASRRSGAGLSQIRRQSVPAFLAG